MQVGFELCTLEHDKRFFNHCTIVALALESSTCIRNHSWINILVMTFKKVILQFYGGHTLYTKISAPYLDVKEKCEDTCLGPALSITFKLLFNREKQITT